MFFFLEEFYVARVAVNRFKRLKCKKILCTEQTKSKRKKNGRYAGESGDPKKWLPERDCESCLS